MKRNTQKTPYENAFSLWPKSKWKTIFQVSTYTGDSQGLKATTRGQLLSYFLKLEHSSVGIIWNAPNSVFVHLSSESTIFRAERTRTEYITFRFKIIW